MESKFGICSFLNQLSPLKGLLKHRISDFIVEELDKDFQVVDWKERVQEQTQQEKNDNQKNIEEVFENLKEFISAQQQLQLKEMLSGQSKSQEGKILIEVTQLNKEERGRIHNKLKEIDKWIISRTIFEQEKSFIQIEVQRFERKEKVVQFVLRKQNIDTMQAINEISKVLKLAPGNLTFCGTKDKRGITVQQITAKNTSVQNIKRFQDVYQQRQSAYISISNVRTAQEMLKLGKHQGNRFTIAIWLLESCDINEIDQRVEELRKVGFLNYFGQQWFGTKENFSTHETGKFLLQKNYYDAFWSVLNADWLDERKNQLLDEFQMTQDFDKVLNDLDRRYSVERQLIINYQQRQDYLESFLKLTKMQRNMYLHSYQSYLWNRAVNKRLELFSLEVQQGDYIRINNEIVQYKGESIDLEQAQVVLPIIGTESNLDQESIAFKIYQEILEEEEIDMSIFEKHNQSFLLSGDWRDIQEIPGQVSHVITSVSDINSDVLDIDSSLDLYLKEEKSFDKEFKVVVI